MSRHTPPPGAKSIAQILDESRSQLNRVTPTQLLTELQSLSRTVHIVDIRPAAQRDREGPFYIRPTDDVLSGPESTSHHVHVIERNVLEWRLDPQCESRLQDVIDAQGYQTRIVVICSEGYTSSLAAVALKDLGLREATDLVGGQKGWTRFLITERIQME